MELKPKDLRLIAYLHHHGREPLTAIAKATHFSRIQVDYNIKKYFQFGIFYKFFPMVNYKRLGYNHFNILLVKFNKPSFLKEFIKKEGRDKNWISRGEGLAHYDLFLICIFKNEAERNSYIHELIHRNHSIISDYLFFEPFYIEMYPLKWLGQKNGEGYILEPTSNGMYNLDEKEKKILKALQKNGRARIIDIAKKTNLSAELIVYKLRNLQDKGVFLGTRIQFRMEKIGYYYSYFLIHFKNFSRENQEKIKDFSRNYKYVDSVSLMMGKPNCSIQVIHKSESELRETLEALRKLFADEEFDIKILPLKTEEEEINTLPFLD